MDWQQKKKSMKVNDKALDLTMILKLEENPSAIASPQWTIWISLRRILLLFPILTIYLIFLVFVNQNTLYTVIIAPLLMLFYLLPSAAVLVPRVS